MYASCAVFSVILSKKYLCGIERKISYAVSIVGILLSQSAAGYILLVLSLYFVCVQHKNHKAFIDYLVLIAGVYLLFNYQQLIDTLLNLNQSVFWKLAGDNLTSNTRLNSPIACLDIFIRNPLTGTGLRYGTDIYTAMKSQYSMDSLTSTSFFYMAAYGIWGISYNILIFLAVFRQKALSVPLRVVLLVIILIILNKEPHYSITVTYVFLFYFSRKDVKESKLACENTIIGQHSSNRNSTSIRRG